MNASASASDRWPIVITVQSASFSLSPAKPHPMISIGTEHLFVQKRRYALGQTAEVGYLYHRNLAHGPYLDTGLVNRFCFDVGLFVQLDLRAGLSWLLYPGTTYVRDETGSYGPGGNQGFLSLRVTPGMQVGFDLRKHTSIPGKVVLRYDQALLFPFWKQTIPTLPYAAVGVGFVFIRDAAR